MNEILPRRSKVRKLILPSIVIFQLMMIFNGVSGKLGKHTRRKDSSDPQFGNSTTHGALVLAI